MHRVRGQRIVIFRGEGGREHRKAEQDRLNPHGLLRFKIRNIPGMHHLSENGISPADSLGFNEA